MENYWKNYWGSAHITESLDRQTQVARTRNGKAIDEENWAKTLNYVMGFLDLRGDDNILDLCGANGLFAIPISKKVQKVTVVDINSNLLESINVSFENIKTINMDVISYFKSNDQLYDKVLFYAGLQYFTEIHAVEIFKELKKILKPAGKLFVGDIPNLEKRKEFLRANNRYFNTFVNAEGNKETIGTWYDSEWLLELSKYLGYSKCKILNQPIYQIYSDFRFDIILEN